jgi:hypothetical protein
MQRQMIHDTLHRFANCGAPLEGALLVLWGGGSSLYAGHIYLIFIYHLVPVLAANYKQHILSPAKLRNVCYSLADLYVKSVYLNFFSWRGPEVHTF